MTTGLSIRAKKIQDLQKKLDQLTAQQERIDTAAKKRKIKKERKDSNRRKILIGAAVLSRIGDDVEANKEHRQFMMDYLTRDCDRRLFGFDLLPKTTDQPEDQSVGLIENLPD